ncbi:hypothetical protein [Acidianus sp. HS-5]|uniref:hypothetical protein n=1 Tax=Acidianus sp. HS-5 TaxID=2886040 RepID=UPI001F16EBA6|nr:hypothetical protein [Acidianus sp. HS-5]BDC17651.1 hypothetical protein HS5_05410 [Acidianus sp. HS-5]
MKTTLLLALVAISSLGAGIGIAGVMGYGPLAYISYHIQTQTQQVIPAHINLGNLTAGESSNVTANATVTVRSNGTYEIKLLHGEKLQKAFSEFEVKITIGNTTLMLTPKNDTASVNLTKGTYVVFIEIIYQVSQHPKGDLNVLNEPLLIIHPKE